MFLSADDPDPEKPSGTEAGMEALVSFPCPIEAHPLPLSVVPSTCARPSSPGQM